MVVNVIIPDKNEPPPQVKRRTRIKINQHINNISENPQPEPESERENEERHIVVGIYEKKTAVCDNDLSSDCDTGTYEISKSSDEKNANFDNENVDTESEEDVFIPDRSGHDLNPNSPIVNTAPTPAPRTRVSKPTATETYNDIDVDLASPATDKDNAADKEIKKSPTVSPPPHPRPRTAEQTVQVDEGKLIKDKKKKLKAADLIASVLRKESKNLRDAVATPLAEIKESGKEVEKDEGTGSPWDSPPSPQTLDKVYIQHKHGFSVQDWADLFKKTDHKKETPRNRCLMDVAIQFHDLWSRLMMFSHGVLAGIACCHILSVAAVLASTQNDIEQFVHFYHFLSLKVHFVVYVFTTLCIISCFDRIDIGDMSKRHLREIGRAHGTLLTTIAYLFSLVLTLCAHRHTAAIEEYKSNSDLWDVQGLQNWYWLVTTRDVVLLIIWIFIAFSHRSDLLRDRLVNMGEKKARADTMAIFNIDLQPNQ